MLEKLSVLGRKCDNENCKHAEHAHGMCVAEDAAERAGDRIGGRNEGNNNTIILYNTIHIITLLIIIYSWAE